MRNGLTLTGNSDLAYVGQWYDQGSNGTGAEVDDNSNLVLATSDDALPAGFAHRWDNISFRFMGDMGQSQGAASGVEGLEMMRIRPFRATVDDPVEGFVGVGDFLSAMAGPEERLDILDRTIRIRQLIPDYQNNTLDRVVVSDAGGTLHWRNANTLGGQDCDWVITATNDVVTAYLPTADPDCPDEANNVGVGTDEPIAKLHVVKVVNSGDPFDEGIRTMMRTTSLNNVGGRAFSQPANEEARNIGWQGHASNAGRNWGVDGNAAWNSLANQETWNGVRVVGVRGFADGNFMLDPSEIRGV